MSGGVDSSVAAWLLKEQGYQPVGVFMRVGAAHAEPQACDVPAAPERPRRLRHGCCSASDAIDARSVAGRLGISFYALNFEADFDKIIEYFVDEYQRARTPNPCAMCNIQLKFGKLFDYADLLGAEWVATGHYARILSASGQTALARARNLAKDQSYVLFGMPRPMLPRVLFPLGEFSDKAEVRSIAAGLGLRVHDKPDSQEICFVPKNDYRELLLQRRPAALRPGAIVDRSGRTLTQHAGVAAFTIGQRRGLGFAAGAPMYVTRLDVLNNAVVVGPREELLAGGMIADTVNWLMDAPSAARPVRIKIRHMHTPAAGMLRLLNDGAVAGEFDEPQLAVTPGQAAVFYDGQERVIGGGWIRAATGPSQSQPDSETAPRAERTGVSAAD